jgi:hypothetical protein
VKLLLDEMLSAGTAEQIRGRGHDAGWDLHNGELLARLEPPF